MAKKSKSDNNYYGYNGTSRQIGFGYGNYGWDPFEDSHPFYLTKQVKKDDIITPNISWWTEDTLLTKVKYNLNNILITEFNLKPEELDKYIKDFMIRDIYKMFYNSPLYIKPTSDKYWWSKLLQMMDNYLIKIATNNRELNSFVTTDIICQELLRLIVKKDVQDKQTNDDWKKALNKFVNNEINENSKSQDNNQEQKPSNSKKEKSNKKKDEQKPQSLHEKNQTEQNIKEFKKVIEKSVEKAMKKIEENNTKYSSYGIGNDIDSIDELVNIQNLFKNINISARQLASFVKNSIKKFSNCLGSNSIKIEEDFLESEDFNEILNMENIMFDEFIDDLVVSNTKQYMKYDLYIDISGSMNEYLYFSDNEQAKRIDVCKVLAIKMNTMNILGDRYFFYDNIKKISSQDEFYSQRAKGGTRTNKVFEKINESKRPSVILTDGSDSYDVYSKNVYIISIEQNNSNQTNVLKKYIQNKQIVHYSNGKFNKYILK